MNRETNAGLTLTLSALERYIPVATQFVERTAEVFGLQKERGLRLGLATEEIFSYLASAVCPGQTVEIRCVNGYFYIRVEFWFSVSTMNMGALNITASGNCNEGDMATMGLVIASRTVDRLNITAGRRRICLSIAIDKEYPAANGITFTQPDGIDGLSVRTPNPEELKSFIIRAGQDIADVLRPTYLRYPGRVVDMVAGGNCQALVAFNGKQEILGGLLAVNRTERFVLLIGPYGFYPAGEVEVAETLLNDCLSKIARTKVIAILNVTGLPAVIRPQFEALGDLRYYQAGGSVIERPTFYRLLHEDPGCLIWTDGALADYLRSEYKRLFLAREIREVKDLGEAKAGASIFSTHIRKELTEVTIRPLWPGTDADDNLKRHIRCLGEESILNIFFELDLGIPWHASLMPILSVNNFRPEMIIPFAGKADMAVFQYHDPA
ncbi:MAG: hypothetical protein PHN75_04490 [Syntrophales bacterium]|nr:hypothetical protein [Syntrophales bacterium]